jgi:hypothetical protein
MRSETTSHNHYLQFYESETYLIETVCRFVSEGLGKGCPVVVLATSAHRWSLSRRLTALGVDFEHAIHRGDVLFFDAHDALAMFTVNESPDPRLFRMFVLRMLGQSRHGRESRQVYAYGELVDVLWQAGKRVAALQLEDYWNDLQRNDNFVLLCGYSLANFELAKPEEVHALHAAHTHVMVADAPIPAALPVDQAQAKL